MQFHREFQSFLCDHIPLRKSTAWQDWYANEKFEVQAGEITFSTEPGSHSKSLLWVSEFSHSVPTNSQFKHFLKTSLEAVWFNHVPVLLWCDFSDSCYYLSGWTGTKKSLMLDIRKEREPGCGHGTVQSHIIQKHWEYFSHSHFSQIYWFLYWVLPAPIWGISYPWNVIKR